MAGAPGGPTVPSTNVRIVRVAARTTFLRMNPRIKIAPSLRRVAAIRVREALRAGAARRSHDRDHRSIELLTGKRAEEASSEGEDSAVGSGQKITVLARGDVDDGCREGLSGEGPLEGRVAEGEDSAVASDQPVPP